MEWEEAFEIFLAAQDYAKVQLDEAAESDKQYWQGVKDGLRKCYAIFANDPKWDGLSGGSPQPRPIGARYWPL